MNSQNTLTNLTFHILVTLSSGTNIARIGLLSLAQRYLRPIHRIPTSHSQHHNITYGMKRTIPLSHPMLAFLQENLGPKLVIFKPKY